MRTWEYTKIALNEASRQGDDVDVLCAAGENGWELVAVLPNGVAYLKREIPKDDPEGLDKAAQNVGDGVKRQTIGAVASEDQGSQVRPKYRNPATGETWSGRGRMASWLKRKVDAGDTIDKYLV
jgi:hypothetical protein